MFESHQLLFLYNILENGSFEQSLKKPVMVVSCAFVVCAEDAANSNFLNFFLDLILIVGLLDIFHERGN